MRGLSFQSDACQALTKVLVFWGDVTWIGGGTNRRGGTDLQQGLFQGSLHSPVQTVTPCSVVLVF